MAGDGAFYFQVRWTKVTFQFKTSRIRNFLARVKRNWDPLTEELEKSGQESIEAVEAPLVMQVIVRKASCVAKPITCQLCCKEIPCGKPILLPSGWSLITRIQRRTQALSAVDKKFIYKINDGRVERVYLDRLILNPWIKFKTAEFPDYEMKMCSDCGDRYLRSETAATSVHPSSNPVKASLLKVLK